MSEQSGAVMADRRPAEMVAGELGEQGGAGEVEEAAPGEWQRDLSPWGVTEWRLPGEGERGSRCGEWYPDAVCETCGEVDMSSHICGKRSCPDCWGVWAKEAAVRATKRIQAFRYTQPDDWHRQVAHAVVSPPEGDVMNEQQYWDGRTKAAEMAEEKGFRGFTVIPHPYRPNDDGKEAYREADPEYGIWVWLRNDVEDMERFIKWSPHYHIVGATGADMDPAEEADDWTYEFLRSVESFDGVTDRESHEDLYGLFRYILSHTGFPAESTKQVTTWYGDLANSVFVEEATAEWQHEKPAARVRDRLEREIEAVAGPTEDDDGDGSAEEDDTEGECPVGECDGVLIGVFDVTMYLRQVDVPPEVEEAMRAARDWRLGELDPPPGLKHPRTEEQAREALEAVL